MQIRGRMKTRFLCLFILLGAVSQLFAEFFWMPAIFSHGMVLQRGQPVNIWGVSDPNAKIDIYFNWKTTSTTAGKHGEWSAELPPMPANSEGMAMTIFVNKKPFRVIGEVLVGEVWILGGQSNMELQLQYMMSRKNMDHSIAHINAAKRAVANAQNLPIRVFYQPILGDRVLRRDNPPHSFWITKITDKQAGRVSALGYFFAEALHRKTNVPVGIVQTQVNGAKMVAFIPEAAVALDGDYAAYHAKFKKLADGDTREKSLERWRKANADFDAEQARLKAAGKPVRPKSVLMRDEPQNGVPYPYNFRNTPAFLYNKMVAPLLRYTAKGVLWYQGESDAGKDEAAHFQRKFEVLIEKWREAAGKPELPFYCVQLASFGSVSDFAGARWAQYRAARGTPHCGIVNIIDTGLEKDVHPLDKDIVGARMANLAMQDVYGFKDCFGCAPEMKRVSYLGKAASVAIEDFGRGIELSGNLRGFEALINGAWVAAPAEYKDGVIIVRSPNGGDIAGVRYLHKNWARPYVCIFNKDGLPMFPFDSLK